MFLMLHIPGEGARGGVRGGAGARRWAGGDRAGRGGARGGGRRHRGRAAGRWASSLDPVGRGFVRLSGGVAYCAGCLAGGPPTGRTVMTVHRSADLRGMDQVREGRKSRARVPTRSTRRLK
ncbi:hypothetical protein CXF46_03390 [Corynebacterium bovis]|nr:hypothetical protein CXF45_07165 [Corynebacterium bovis]RRQ17046.1 hypothetical protein CXF46_03390 [Corynebacterium bovis]